MRRADLDASLGDGDGLLLHGLMDGHLVLLVHLVKLVDAADAVVRQHERACLDAEFATVAVLQATHASISGRVQPMWSLEEPKDGKQQFSRRYIEPNAAATSRN